MMLFRGGGRRRSRIAQITTSPEEGSKRNGVQGAHARIMGLKRGKLAKKQERLLTPSTEPTVEARPVQGPVVSLLVTLVGQLVDALL